MTNDDVGRIADAVVEKLEANPGTIADAVVEKLEANSLGDMKRDIASMAEDVAKIPLIEAEVREINQRLENLEDRL